MSKMKRRHYRVPVSYEVVFYWEDASGVVYTTRPRARDISNLGLRVESTVAIQPGTHVCLEVPRHDSAIETVVRYCEPEGSAFRVGVEFEKEQQQLAHSAGVSAVSATPGAKMKAVAAGTAGVGEGAGDGFGAGPAGNGSKALATASATRSRFSARAFG